MFFYLKEMLIETHIKKIRPLKEAQRIPIARFALCANSQNEVNEKNKVFKKRLQKNDEGASTHFF